jgi:hypothetical protein
MHCIDKTQTWPAVGHNRFVEIIPETKQISTLLQWLNLFLEKVARIFFDLFNSKNENSNDSLPNGTIFY